MTPDKLRELANAIEEHDRAVQGDGQATFMPDMTDEEYAIHILEHDKGWKGFYEKVRNLGRDPE